MEEYTITIKVTIDVPNHTEALKIQNDLTNVVSNYAAEDINPVSKISSSMKAK